MVKQLVPCVSQRHIAAAATQHALGNLQLWVLAPRTKGPLSFTLQPGPIRHMYGQDSRRLTGIFQSLIVPFVTG